LCFAEVCCRADLRSEDSVKKRQAKILVNE
jgi:hypothetical protein